MDSRLPARGTDIYGQAVVTRVVLELNAAVQPGDSGGPFVLADGTVGGLVFAASRTETGIGYALDPTAVAADIQGVLGGRPPSARATAPPEGSRQTPSNVGGRMTRPLSSRR